MFGSAVEPIYGSLNKRDGRRALFVHNWAPDSDPTKLSGECFAGSDEHLDRVATTLGAEPAFGLIVEIIESGPAWAETPAWQAVSSAFDSNEDPEEQLEAAWDSTPPELRQYHPGEVPLRIADETRAITLLFDSSLRLVESSGFVFVRTVEAVSYAGEAGITEPAVILVPQGKEVQIEVSWQSTTRLDGDRVVLATHMLDSSSDAVIASLDLESGSIREASREEVAFAAGIDPVDVDEWRQDYGNSFFSRSSGQPIPVLDDAES